MNLSIGSSVKGKSVEHVLSVLSDIDGAAFDTLSKRFRVYASCVGASDTAYFRRRRRLALRPTFDLSGEEYPEGTRQRRRREEPVVDDDDDGNVQLMEGSWMDGPVSMTRLDR